MFFKCCFCSNTNKINNNRIIVNDKLNGNDGMNTHSNLHHIHRHPKYINTQKKHPNWLSLSSQLIRQREFESNWTLTACILYADCVSHRNSVEKRQSVNLVNMPLYRKHWANLFICIWMIDRLLPSRDTYLNAHTRSRTRQIDQTYSNISSDFAHRKRMGIHPEKNCAIKLANILLHVTRSPLKYWEREIGEHLRVFIAVGCKISTQSLRTFSNRAKHVFCLTRTKMH